MVRFINDNLRIDPSKNVQIHTIAAGLPRCATSSMQAAFESKHLALSPTMHMEHMIPHANRLQMAITMLHEQDAPHRQAILHQIFDGFVASADFPGCVFLPDLMGMYADAKIILNQRESGETWAKSMSETIVFFTTWWYRITCFPVKTDRLLYHMIQDCCKVWAERSGVPANEVLTSPAFYRFHNDWVREKARKRGKKVLEFQPKDGWMPVCKFLGIETVPDEPFPRLNDKTTMDFVKRIMVTRGLLAWAALGGFGRRNICRYQVVEMVVLNTGELSTRSSVFEVTIGPEEKTVF